MPSTDFRHQLDATVGALRVDRDNVLQMRAGILAEADRLDRAFSVARQGARVGLCGRSYVEALRESARALDAAARRYGYTEDEIAASFRGLG